MFWEVPLDGQIVAELDKIIERLAYDSSVCDHQDYDVSVTPEHANKRVTPSALEEILKGRDRNVATADENLLRLPPEFVKDGPLPQMFESFIKDFCEIGDQPSIFHVTGKFWYPSNGYMGWHTNNTYPGFRLYCTHAQDSSKSFFRYRNPLTNEIVTSWDRQGWMCRIFKIDRELP